MVFVIRAIHSAISLFFVGCLGYVYYAGLTRKRTRLLAAAAAALIVEGAAVTANGGDCPLGPVHRRYGDDKTFFELFLPPRLARRAVPALAGVAAVGFALVVARPPKRPAARG